jgi:hypothetical protein
VPSPRRQAPSRPCAGPSLLLPAARPCERPGIGSRAPRSNALQGPVRATTSGARLQRRTDLTAATASTKATCRWPSRRSISKGLPAPGAGRGCAVATRTQRMTYEWQDNDGVKHVTTWTKAVRNAMIRGGAEFHRQKATASRRRRRLHQARAIRRGGCIASDMGHHQRVCGPEGWWPRHPSRYRHANERGVPRRTNRCLDRPCASAAQGCSWWYLVER